MKVRIKFRKYGALKFIGHLDVMRFFQKAMRRAEIPIAFTGGYSPHMIMSFANPLGIGLTSDGEYFDIELKEPISSEAAVRQLNQVMVEGIEVLSFRQIAEEKKMTGMAIVAAADYRTTLVKGEFPENWLDRAKEFIAQPEIRIMKQTKRSEKEVDIKPMIYQFRPVEENGGQITFYMQVASGSVENLKPGLVMEALCGYMGINPEEVSFACHRLEMYADTGVDGTRQLVSLENLGTEIPQTPEKGTQCTQMSGTETEMEPA
ncbi:TIGR03936 family radical SAM-associated protein [Faecalicatena sp. AGMB00832]|uniref:TIGR03936 family radical SAM-associated protein n=1 Tax=Faecalicatena faecalis TaxID=2726362 RepID=A0ABS6D563_9FIRM|nr:MULTISPECIES: TIGR03936 family radical SAM-associated protein [Faecalicatena]MBU3876738.1 TIGR03936 family radical SAM-associated protein [Faecalicatena faecalis]MCI6464436.1 TIGR03936 family radical SAM-associated protein [Faecalicatena sp.]MDY5620174.1 TIGR03936 family radical SAM-associated protein [Lachnospiraceae bacterium]